jgi:hypothetical protein
VKVSIKAIKELAKLVSSEDIEFIDITEDKVDDKPVMIAVATYADFRGDTWERRHLLTEKGIVEL